MSNTSNSCTITNESGIDVVAALAINAEETVTSGAILTYGKSLEILIASTGNTVIKNGASASVAPGHKYTSGDEKDKDVTTYDLQVCDSNIGYPVALLNIAADDSSDYEAQTVPAKGEPAVRQAFDFYQTLSAYPGSKLSKDYRAALAAAKEAAFDKADGGADSAKASAEAISDTINAFFKTTSEYKNVTLAHTVSVNNYYNNFLFVWSQYKDSLTYYLYGADESTATFEGTLALTKPGKTDLTVANSGFECLFTPAINPTDPNTEEVDASKAVKLTYINGLFVDDPAADTPQVSLKGNFLLKGLFTGNDDDKDILTVLTGNIKGRICIGFDVSQAPENNPVKAALTGNPPAEIVKYWDRLIHPKSQYDYIISLMTLGGALMLVASIAFAVYRIYKLVQGMNELKEAADRKIIERTAKEKQAWDDANDEIRFGKWCGPNKDIFVELNEKNMEGYEEVLRNNARANKMLKALRKQKEAIEELEKFSESLQSYEVTQINDVIDDIKQTYKDLSEAKRGDLGDLLPEAYKTFSSNQGTINRFRIQLSAKLTGEAKGIVEDGISASSTIFDNLQTQIENDEKAKDELDPETKGKVEPEIVWSDSLSLV